MLGLWPLLWPNGPKLGVVYDIYPRNLSSLAILVGAFLMACCGLALAWNKQEGRERQWIHDGFRIAWKGLVLATIVLALVYGFAVRFQSEGCEKNLCPVQVGFYRSGEGSVCHSGNSDYECLLKISFDRNAIEAEWGGASVRLTAAALQLAYWTWACSLVWTVGLVILSVRSHPNVDVPRPR